MVLATFAACSSGDTGPTADHSNLPDTVRLTSTAFADGSDIPEKYTCDGADVSPPLTWSNVPQGTRSLALIVDDPDARGWTHWSLYNIPTDVEKLPEAVTSPAGSPTGTIAGVNDFKRKGYGGPCPPGGAPHRYLFKIYALEKG